MVQELDPFINSTSLLFVEILFVPKSLMKTLYEVFFPTSDIPLFLFSAQLVFHSLFVSYLLNNKFCVELWRDKAL